jgi:acyl carrier protein
MKEYLGIQLKGLSEEIDMNIQKFIEKFAEQFENTDLSEFKSETVFKTLDEWSSLITLSVIAMIDEEYKVNLKTSDIRNSQTIQNLYDIVKSRTQEV